MALALRLAAHLSCTGLPMGLPFPRQGDFSPGVAHWAMAAVVALLFGLCYNSATRVPPGHVSSHLGHGESVARFLSHAAQPNMRKFSRSSA